MMIEHVRLYTFPAAFSLLPPSMNTPHARAMLLAIGLQESRFQHRRQVGGPAHGFWQFEQGGGVKGVMTHHATRALAAHVLDDLQYRDPSVASVYQALPNNDTLACIFARLLLWTVPGRLAEPDQPQLGWEQYISGWRPGKPHRGTWDSFFNEAWARVRQ